MTAIRGILSIVCCCAALLWTGACEEELTPVASRTPTTAPAEPVLREAETGPVKVTVTADRDRFVIPEQMRLVVRVEAEAGVEVTAEAFKDFAGPFAVADMAETEPDCGEFFRCAEWAYTLEGILPGTHELPGMTFRFRDARPKADGSSAVYEDVVTTEPMSIVVSHGLADIEGPVSLPMPWPYRLLLWAAGVVAVMVAIALFARWCLRRRVAAAEALPEDWTVAPHLWALSELDALEREGLVGRGLFHDFYHRINGLLRRYVELRFGLMAGEQTSEEFLRCLADDAALSQPHKEVLQRFVAACDPVKYAGQIPRREEVDWVHTAARSFVLETADHEQEAVT